MFAFTTQAFGSNHPCDSNMAGVFVTWVLILDIPSNFFVCMIAA